MEDDDDPSNDVTPEGQPIDTHTIWLPFDDDEIALSLDLTRWNAAMRRWRKS